ncbi:MAG: COG3014 family protein [Bdellovibrio sp.]
MKTGLLIRSLLIWIGVLFLLSSCATYQNKLREPRALLKEGRFSEAIEKLRPLAEKKSDDQLVYLMELGSAYQMAGQYKESTEVFLKADRLADQVDYTSVSNVTLAALGSEEMIQYKGDSFEKLLINANTALNSTMLGQFDDALVDARRINDKINTIRLAGREDYEKNSFAEYLSGLLWEADRNFDNAYISYENAYKIDPSIPFLAEDLIRGAKKARRQDTYKKWKKEFPSVSENPDWYDKNKGEIVVVILQGWGPRKDFSPENRRIPRLYPTSSMTASVRAELVPAVMASSQDKTQQQNSKPVYNIEQVAIRTLDADYGWLVARKIGAFAAKEVMADQIRQKNEVLGLVAWLGMHLSDRADLRQWSTLPETVQLARFWVNSGSYRLNLKALDAGGTLTSEMTQTPELTVKAGQKTFYLWRPLQ